MMRKGLYLALGAALAAALVAAAACSSDPTSPSVGRVNVFLTDTPLDLETVNAVNVTLDEMRLFHTDSMDDADGMEMERPNVSAGQGLTLNLLEFQNGRTVMIASLDAPAGDYQKLRMYVSAAELVMPDPDDAMLEVVEPVYVPSGKVDIPVTFTITGGETTDVTIDFDASLSVQVNSTPGGHPYILRPVITPVRVTSR